MIEVDSQNVILLKCQKRKIKDTGRMFGVFLCSEKEWLYCPVKLHNGDCLELMKNIPGGSIDMILCDLPYGTTACKWDSVIPFVPLWEQYERIIKENGAIVLFSIQPFTTKLIHSNFKRYKYNWYWQKNNKTGSQYARVQPMRCIEDICVFYKKVPTYNPQGLIKLEKPIYHKKTKSNVYSYRASGSIQRFKNYPCHLLKYDSCGIGKDKRLHPTQKPVALLEYLIKTYTNSGETVLDSCMGSGSTGVACVNTERKFIGIELERKYYEISKQRIENAVFSLQK